MADSNGEMGRDVTLPWRVYQIAPTGNRRLQATWRYRITPTHVDVPARDLRFNVEQSKTSFLLGLPLVVCAWTIKQALHDQHVYCVRCMYCLYIHVTDHQMSRAGASGVPVSLDTRFEIALRPSAIASASRPVYRAYSRRSRLEPRRK